MNDNNKLSLGLASLPLITMIVLFALGAAFLEMNNEVLLLIMLSAAVVATMVAQRVGKSWDDVQRSTGDKLAAALPALLILLSIGMLIGTWVCSGTIPLMVYYGLKLVNPNYLAVTAFLATSAMSICTGTSWGSAGTIGVALMGMAAALGAPLAPMAGAIVSGAYFGDKMSPLSDSTNIAAIGAGSHLYRHIRLMVYTSGPSYLIAGIVYLIAVKVPGSSSALPPAAQRLLDELSSIYSLSAIALLPIIIVVIGIARRTPPVIAIVISSAVAALTGMALQGFSLTSVLMSAVQGFNVTMLADKGLDPRSLEADTLALLNRGGMYSMSNTLLLIIAAFLLAGAMDVSGALDRLINQLLKMVNSTFALIAATMASGLAMISLTSNNGVTCLVVGELFQKAYDERGFARENLSRSMEDSVTIVEPLLPWTVSAVYMATTLGVPTISYAPWAFFCFGGPIFSLLYAATYDRLGFGLKRAVVDG